MESIEIDNSKQYTRPNDLCPICGVPLNVRVVFHNTPENCRERVTFPYMGIGESMHMECYIQHVIDTYIQSKLDDKSVTK